MGVLPNYRDLQGTLRETADAAREAILAAMGLDASSEEAARGAAEAREEEEALRALPPSCVVPDRTRADGLRIRRGDGGATRWRAEVRGEDGSAHDWAGSVPRGGGDFHLPLPADLAHGYHTLRLTLAGPGGRRCSEHALIRTPDTCVAPAERLPDGRGFGVQANLYALRSRRDWGIGDLADLETLSRWARTEGASFVGVSPLHTLSGPGSGFSPYSPASRLYFEPIHVAVDSVPERDAPGARALLDDPAFAREVAGCHAADRVDYSRVAAAKERILRAMHAAFAARHRGRRTARGREYRRFREREGSLLDEFATFRALAARRGAGAGGPRSPEVTAFGASHAEEVDFHRFVQFELDRQLARAAGTGLALGLYLDLALGTAADGFDPWAFPGLFLEGATLGAPPDDYAADGQDWGLPPLSPVALAEDGYRYWILLLRAILRHAGMVRLDHAMGMARQFWIPAGGTGRDGAYVAYPADDLLGILALESRRAAAVIVGEDLGTVPEGFSDLLQRWGVLSYRMLWFERERDGSFRPPGAYSGRALVAVHNHDLPSLQAFWRGSDIAAREAVGVLDRDAAAGARRDRLADRSALRRTLGLEGDDPEAAEVAASAHRFLANTPAPLVSVTLEDLLGSAEPANLPGTTSEAYPNWAVRLRHPLEEIPHLPQARRALRPLASRRCGPEDRETNTS